MANAQTPSVSPRTARFLSTTIATLVLLAMAALVALVAGYLVWAWPSIPALIIGAILAAIVLFVLPRPSRLPAGAIITGRSEAPEIWSLVDEVSDAANAPRFAVLAWNGDFNAATLRVGFRRRRALVLGLALWESLTSAERIAVLAHEAGHEANGDPRRSAFVGQSLDVLAGWHDVMHPGPWSRVGDPIDGPGLHAVVDQITWVAQRVAVIPIAWLYRRQLRITLVEHRAAEFAADVTSVEVAGLDATRSTLEATTYATSVMFAMERARRSGADLWSAARASISGLSSEAKQSYLARAAESEDSVDATHPPTIARLDALPAVRNLPTVRCEGARARDIDRELELPRDQIADAIRERQVSLDG